MKNLLEVINNSHKHIKILKVMWECTNACNLRCSHCLTDSGFPLKGELTTKEAYQLFEILQQIGVKEIDFTGREPTLRKDLVELVDYAKNLNLKVNLFTNGTADLNLYSKLTKYINAVQLSIYSTKEQVHDSITGVKGSLRRALRTLKLLKDSGVDLIISFIVMKANFQDLRDVMVLAKEYDAKFRLGILLPIGRARKNLKDLMLSPDEVSDFIQKNEEEIRGTINHSVYVRLTETYFKKFDVVPCPLDTITVTATGDVIACSGLRDYIAGNVKRADVNKLRKIIRQLTSFRLNVLNVHNIETCSKCELRYACMGGCRAITYTYLNQ